MPKIKGRFHEVRAWDGIPGMDVTERFARRLDAAGIAVTTYTRREAVKRRAFLSSGNNSGAAAWGSSPVANAGPFNADDDDEVGEVVVEPEQKGYKVATPLARCEPEAELAIWVAHNFTPDELDAIYRLQETDARGRRDQEAWVKYLQGLRDESMEGTGT